MSLKKKILPENGSRRDSCVPRPLQASSACLQHVTGVPPAPGVLLPPVNSSATDLKPLPLYFWVIPYSSITQLAPLDCALIDQTANSEPTLGLKGTTNKQNKTTGYSCISFVPLIKPLQSSAPLHSLVAIDHSPLSGWSPRCMPVPAVRTPPRLSGV